jgi:type IV pilus assembly protein PilW
MLNKKIRLLSSQKGLSLVELMISVTLGLIIMGGVLQLYASASRNASNAQGVSRIQENIRYAVTRLGNDIARSGSMGCFSFSAVGLAKPLGNGEAEADGIAAIDKSIVNYLPNRFVVVVDDGVNGTTKIVNESDGPEVGGDGSVWYDFENSFISGANDLNGDAEVLNGTDTLVVKFLDSSETIQIEGAPNNTSFTLSNVQGIQNGDVVFAGDCSTVYAFNVAGVAIGSQNISIDDASITVNAISGNFTHDLKIGNFSKLYIGESGAYRYFVGTAVGALGACTSVGDGRSNCSLFRAFNGGDSMELVKGVHDFQVLYGHEGASADTAQANGSLTVDRVQVTMSFNTIDAGALLTKTITHVFAVRNQL